MSPFYKFAESSFRLQSTEGLLHHCDRYYLTMSERLGQLLPDDNSDKAAILADMVDEFGDQHEQTQQTTLDKVIKEIERSLREMAEDHPGRSAYVNTPVQKLYYRYEQTEHVKDLEEAIKMAELAVEATPHGHPDQAVGLDQLGILLESRFEWT